MTQLYRRILRIILLVVLVVTLLHLVQAIDHSSTTSITSTIVNYSNPPLSPPLSAALSVSLPVFLPVHALSISPELVHSDSLHKEFYHHWKRSGRISTSNDDDDDALPPTALLGTNTRGGGRRRRTTTSTTIRRRKAFSGDEDENGNENERDGGNENDDDDDDENEHSGEKQGEQAGSVVFMTLWNSQVKPSVQRQQQFEGEEETEALPASVIKRKFYYVEMEVGGRKQGKENGEIEQEGQLLPFAVDTGSSISFVPCDFDIGKGKGKGKGDDNGNDNDNGMASGMSNFNPNKSLTFEAVPKREESCDAFLKDNALTGSRHSGSMKDKNGLRNRHLGARGEDGQSHAQLQSRSTENENESDGANGRCTFTVKFAEGSALSGYVFRDQVAARNVHMYKDVNATSSRMNANTKEQKQKQKQRQSTADDRYPLGSMMLGCTAMSSSVSTSMRIPGLLGLAPAPRSELMKHVINYDTSTSDSETSAQSVEEKPTDMKVNVKGTFGLCLGVRTGYMYFGSRKFEQATMDVNDDGHWDQHEHEHDKSKTKTKVMTVNETRFEVPFSTSLRINSEEDDGDDGRRTVDETGTKSGRMSAGKAYIVTVKCPYFSKALSSVSSDTSKKETPKQNQDQNQDRERGKEREREQGHEVDYLPPYPTDILEMILDSGTSYSWVPRESFVILRAHLLALCAQQTLQCERATQVFIQEDPLACFKLPGNSRDAIRTLKTFPHLVWELETGQIRVPAVQYMFQVDARHWCVGIMQHNAENQNEMIIFGANMFQGLEIEFNVNKRTIGFTRSMCDQGSQSILCDLGLLSATRCEDFSSSSSSLENGDYSDHPYVSIKSTAKTAFWVSFGSTCALVMVYLDFARVRGWLRQLCQVGHSFLILLFTGCFNCFSSCSSCFKSDDRVYIEVVNRMQPHSSRARYSRESGGTIAVSQGEENYEFEVPADHDLFDIESLGEDDASSHSPSHGGGVGKPADIREDNREVQASVDDEADDYSGSSEGDPEEEEEEGEEAKEEGGESDGENGYTKEKIFEAAKRQLGSDGEDISSDESGDEV